MDAVEFSGKCVYTPPLYEVLSGLILSLEYLRRRQLRKTILPDLPEYIMFHVLRDTATMYQRIPEE